MSVRWRWVPQLPRVLGGTTSAEKVLHKRAEAAADVARLIAPVDEGDYRDSIDADDNELVATDWKASLLEFGTRDTPAFATLRTAARHVADRVVDT